MAVYFFGMSQTVLTTRAVNIASLSGASNCPTVASQVLVSDNDQHVIAFGANPIDLLIKTDCLLGSLINKVLRIGLQLPQTPQVV